MFPYEHYIWRHACLLQFKMAFKKRETAVVQDCIESKHFDIEQVSQYTSVSMKQCPCLTALLTLFCYVFFSFYAAYKELSDVRRKHKQAREIITLKEGR